MVNFNPRITQLDSKWWERVVYASEAKKSEFLVHLDHFSKFLKYFKYFEKGSKWTKNLNFIASEAYTFWAKLGYSRIKIDHIADSLLKLEYSYKCWTSATPYSVCTSNPIIFNYNFGFKNIFWTHCDTVPDLFTSTPL